MSELETIRYTASNGRDVYCPGGTFARPLASVTCKRRDCPRCGVTWAKNWQRVTFTNLDAYRGPVSLVSITAPGADVLPWDCDRDHKHAGWKGCRCRGDELDAWSERRQANFKALRDAARRSAIRRTGVAPTLLERVWEPQKRGAPHAHLVVGMKTDLERRSAQVFADELARLAPEYVFGYVDRGQRQDDGSRRLALITAEEAAKYLTSYLLGRASARKAKPSIRENIADPRMPRSLVWVTPRLTRITRCTVRILRAARWYHAALAGKASMLPRFYGPLAVDVARYASYVERTRGRQDDDPPDDERPAPTFLWHLRTIGVMRQLAAAPA